MVYESFSEGGGGGVGGVVAHDWKYCRGGSGYCDTAFADAGCAMETARVTADGGGVLGGRDGAGSGRGRGRGSARRIG